METREETRGKTQERAREEVLALAERLARREGFSPSWLTYPKWAGAAPELRPYLEKADKFKAWAQAILKKAIPPPPWLAEEDPKFRDPERNKPAKNPNNLPAAQRRWMARNRFACRIALETPIPGLKALPRPKSPPSREEIIDLAMRLDGDSFPRHFPEFLYRYPGWASHPPQYAPALERVAQRKAQAARILNGEERPPAWLVRREPARWTPVQPVKTAPAPCSLSEAESHFQRRAHPLIAAWILVATSPSPPARPPPIRKAVWRSPRRAHGDARPVLPPAREQETRCVTEEKLFDN